MKRASAAIWVLLSSLGACGGVDESAELRGDDAALETDAVSLDAADLTPSVDVVRALDAPTVDIADVPATMDVTPPGIDLPSTDTGPRPTDTGPRPTDTGPRPTDSGPRPTDSGPRPTDTGPQPVPRPGDVQAGAMCHDLIRSLGVRFTLGPATRGVVDPVTVTTPIEGVHYRYASWTAADRAMVMDCRLAVALVRMSRLLRDRWNITDVQHIGIYNYREIAGTTRLSQHAYAMAIDIGALRAANGTTYSVLTDFVMNGAPTCPPRAANAIDRVLKEALCALYDQRTFNILLSPNYNSAHRNHFHVDLTTGSHFVQIELPSGVDPPHDPFLDLLIDDD